MDVLDKIKADMSRLAGCYAVVNDGVLVVQSAHPERPTSAAQFMLAMQLIQPTTIFSLCLDEGCGCAERLMKQLAPNARVVPVQMKTLD